MLRVNKSFTKEQPGDSITLENTKFRNLEMLINYLDNTSETLEKS